MDSYPLDKFKNIGGVFVHVQLDPATEFNSLFEVAFRGVRVPLRSVSVAVPGSDYNLTLRTDTSDGDVFWQVFVRNEYDSPNLPAHAETILDLGANVGLASIFFARRYPACRIMCVEPEPGNYAAMQANTRALGDRVQTKHAAVWNKSGEINLHTETEDGMPLGEWGVQVSDRPGPDKRMMPCFDVSALMNMAGFERSTF